MEAITLEDVVEGTRGVVKRKGSRGKVNVRGISVDSRTIREGEVFFALQGLHFDGHHYAQEALKKGASAVVVRSDFPLEPSAKKVIFVENPLRAFGDLARYYRQRFHLPIIAITGSNGKTTTKEMTSAVLSTQYNLLKSEKSYNNFIGIPLTLFHLSPVHEVVVLEFGINKPGEMERLCEIAPPSLGVITQISETHLQFLSSLEGVREEKSKVLSKLKSGDHAILNGDDPSTPELRKRTQARVMTFSIQENGGSLPGSARGISRGEFRTGGRTEGKSQLPDQEREDLQASEVHYEGGMTKFLVNQRFPFEIPLLGEFNVRNALAALAVGKVFHIGYDRAREPLRSFRSSPLRMEVSSLGDFILLNDSYNANPASMEEALRVLAKISGKRKIAILGDMLELGARGPECHWKVGEAAAQLGLDLLLASGPLSQDLIQGARRRGMKEVYSFNEKKDLLDFLKSSLGEFRKGDVVLVKGSRGMKMEEVVEKIKSEAQNPNS